MFHSWEDDDAWDWYRKKPEFIKELDHWKSNHDDLVKRCALLRERPDLPVDRTPAYNELIRLQEENKDLKTRLSIMNSQPNYDRGLPGPINGDW